MVWHVLYYQHVLKQGKKSFQIILPSVRFVLVSARSHKMQLGRQNKLHYSLASARAEGSKNTQIFSNVCTTKYVL